MRAKWILKYFKWKKVLHINHDGIFWIRKHHDFVWKRQRYCAISCNFINLKIGRICFDVKSWTWYLASSWKDDNVNNECCADFFVADYFSC